MTCLYFHHPFAVNIYFGVHQTQPFVACGLVHSPDYATKSHFSERWVRDWNLWLGVAIKQWKDWKTRINNLLHSTHAASRYPKWLRQKWWSRHSKAGSPFCHGATQIWLVPCDKSDRMSPTSENKWNICCIHGILNPGKHGLGVKLITSRRRLKTRGSSMSIGYPMFDS